MTSRSAGSLVVLLLLAAEAAAQSPAPSQGVYPGQPAYGQGPAYSAPGYQPAYSQPAQQGVPQGSVYGSPPAVEQRSTVYGPQPAPQSGLYQALPPQNPTIERRADAPAAPAGQPGPAAPQPPFQLTATEQAQLDQVLQAWQQQNSKVKTFECVFTRLTYGAPFADPAKRNAAGADHEDTGEIKYQAPDKGLFHVSQPAAREEQWVCDGKSMFEFDYYKKTVKEYRLPPELQGKGIVDGPVPFLFGASADKLKERYYLRFMPNVPPQILQQQLWIEAYPRYQKDAADFVKAEIILDRQSLQPIALRTHEPNGTTNHVYKLEGQKINGWDPLRKLDPLGILQQDPFRPRVPRGWTKVLEDVPGEVAPQQAARPSGVQNR